MPEIVVQNVHGVTIEIVSQAGVLSIQPQTEQHTGKLSNTNSREITVRNSTQERVRLCLKTKHRGNPISGYFRTPINVENDIEGWVELDRATCGSREYTLLLDAAAWKPLDSNGVPERDNGLFLGVRSLNGTGECAYIPHYHDDDNHPGDVIIDGGN